MDIHKHNARRHEKHQLDQGMIYHVEQRSSCCKQVLTSKQPRHANAHQDQTNL